MQRALRALGERCRRETELVIVGGAAAVLCQWLRRATTDIDVIEADPRLAAISAAVESVADDLGLSRTWLNDGAKGFHEVLPNDFRSRLVHVGTYGALHVRAVSRQDFVLLKFYAFRDTDFEDLQRLQPPLASGEIDFVRAQLSRIESFDAKKAHYIQLYLDQLDPGDRSTKETTTFQGIYGNGTTED